MDKRQLAGLLVLAGALSGQPTGTGVITTVAGGSLAAGDGGPALEALVFLPEGLAVDGAGNLYIADKYNHRVRKVTPAGTITTVAGTGVPGFSGDGGPATSAQLYLPSGVALDAAGNLYIADTQNHRVRRVSPAGIVTTVAGTGTADFRGDAGSAVSAALNGPTAVALDAAGNLYISDTGNHCTRKVSPAGIISTLAGMGVAGFGGDGGPAIAAQLNSPVGLVIDDAGNLYIADQRNHRVRKVTPAGVISTVAGTGVAGSEGAGGPATAAQLNRPFALARDGAGNLYIADDGSARVLKVTPAGLLSIVAGTGVAGSGGDGGPATKAGLNGTRGLALDSSGNLYIADANNFRIRKVSPEGTITTIVGSLAQERYRGDGGPAAESRAFLPEGVAVNAGGDVFFSQLRPGSIRRITRGGTISTIAGIGLPGGIAVDHAGNVYVAIQVSHQVRRITPEGVTSTVAGTGTQGFGGDGGLATEALLTWPYGVAADSAGNLYIAELFNQRVRKVTPAGIITTIAGSSVAGFAGDGGRATEARLNNPAGLALDAAGNLYIADSGNHRIRKVTPAGIITTVAGGPYSGLGSEGVPATASNLYQPMGVAIDPVGNLYIADTGNHRIRRVNPAGIITTMAGTGKPGYAGDGQAASLSQLNRPTIGIAVDLGGNLYIADQNNSRLRKITFPLEVVTASPLPPGPVWTSHSLGLVALGGAPPYNWSVSSGALPPGITLDQATGTLSGIPPTGGTFNFTVRVSDSAGAAATRALTLTVTAPVILSRTLLSFSYQVGDPLPSAQTVTLSSGGEPANFTASVSTTSGGDWLRASPNSGTTPATLSVSVSPLGMAPGAHVGTVTVRAGGISQSVTVHLFISAAGTAPQIAAGGVVNAASLLAGPLAPGEIVTIFGSNLGPTSPAGLQLSEGQVATRVAEVEVLFDNIPGPLVYVQASQLSAIVPYAVAGTAEAKVQVQHKGARSTAVSLRVAASAPGIFTVDATGKGQGAILNQDYTVNSAANPAERGGVVLIYATGEGETDPQVADGSLASAVTVPKPRLPVGVMIGGIQAEVLYAGAAPGMVVGLLQVNVRVPPNVASGAVVPVILMIGGAGSQPGVTLAVR